MKRLHTLIILFSSLLAPIGVSAHGIGEHFHPHLGWEHLLLALVIGIGLTRKNKVLRLFSRKKK